MVAEAQATRKEAEPPAQPTTPCLPEALGPEVEAFLRHRLAEMEAQVEARVLQKLEDKLASCLLSAPTVQATAPDGDPAQAAEARPRSQRTRPLKTAHTQQSGASLKPELFEVEQATPCQFALTHSAWDVSMLIGFDVVGGSESLLLVMLTGLTLLVTLVFCGIVLTNFTAPDFDDTAIRQLEEWRLNTAHMYSELDEIRGVTLASRACEIDKGLASSANQVAIISSIRTYISGNWITSGPAMCMTALVLWYLTLIKEFTHIVRCCCGFWNLSTDYGDAACGGRSGITLISVSRARKAWVVLATVLRLSVMGVLSYAGTLYIVYTIDVKDLLLNCIALEVILHIDDLVFASLASSKLQTKVEMLTPLLLSKPERRPSIMERAWGVMAMSAVGVALALAGTMLLRPYIELLENVEDTLCGGERDFAVFVMQDVGVPIMSYTNPFAATGDDWVFSQRAVRQAINKGKPSPPLIDMFALTTQQSKFHEFQSFAANGDGYPGPDHDALTDIAVAGSNNTAAYLARLRDLLGDAQATCASVQGSPACFEYNSVSSAIRFLCPVSCGCGSLYSGVFMDTNAYCPDGALDMIESLTELLPCSDNSSALRQLGTVKTGGFSADTTCAEVAGLEPWCAKTSVAAFCPESCKCSAAGHPFCPPSCE
mmetsp:Transcript_99556/g.277125  ORF Transcript_99556/g.277125 Transcript_99556/m.277125 type:complete len:656 (-) Transcript_99556:391-2358(-)